MRGLGRGIREFNDAKTNVKNEIEEGMKEKETKKASSAIKITGQNNFQLKSQYPIRSFRVGYFG